MLVPKISLGSYHTIWQATILKDKKKNCTVWTYLKVVWFTTLTCWQRGCDLYSLWAGRSGVPACLTAMTVGMQTKTISMHPSTWHSVMWMNGLQQNKKRIIWLHVKTAAKLKCILRSNYDLWPSSITHYSATPSTWFRSTGQNRYTELHLATSLNPWEEI